LLGKVQTLHKKNLVYGDVHLSNIVFDKKSKTAQLIDFDFSGAAGEKRYPPGWLEIDDGKRHPDAVAGALLQTCHDTFSIAAVLRFFEPTEEAKEGWAAGLELLEKDDLAAALDSFKGLNSSIRVTDGARIPVAKATSSPPPADVAVLRTRRRRSNSTPAAPNFDSPPRRRSSKRRRKDGRPLASSRSLAHHFLGIPCPSPRPVPSAHLSLHRFPSLFLFPSPPFTSSSPQVPRTTAALL
jgi:serine/threonine protein kinase